MIQPAAKNPLPLSPKNTTISFYTLGCRLNQSETAVIQNSFQLEGYDIVNFEQPADIVVINTCTVTEHGDADTRRLVYKINRLNPQARIALIGCQAQIQKEKLTQLPNVRWVVGNAQKMDLVAILKSLKDSDRPRVITPAIPRKNFTIPVAGIDRYHTRANLKIQDGCDFFCSFCEIPYARGRARSRVFADILLEAKTLVAAGHKEIILTGINLGTYREAGKNILDVVNGLEQISGLERIRISSIEPTTIPLALIQKMARPSKLCRYLHIPLQSASNQILLKMGRKYSAEEFQQFIQNVFQKVPEVCIGTDTIVGFPGETDEHFRETYDRLCEWPIHYIHVFSYSKRLLAKSKDFTNEVSPTVIQKRSQVLRELSLRKRRMFYGQGVGTEQTVLFEEEKNGYWTGWTDNYIRVKVLSPDNLANRSLIVRLISVEDKDVLGSY